MEMSSGCDCQLDIDDIRRNDAPVGSTRVGTTRCTQSKQHTYSTWFVGHLTAQSTCHKAERYST